MSICKKLCQVIIVSVTALLTSTGLLADDKIKHVFELFTSQGCYSCPPADQLLGKILEQNGDILGLEFHVDYWDTLVYGSAGKWRDPFSSPAYSKRQRDYNRLSLEGRSGVYTPQMVVNGKHAFVGSKARQARSHINRESTLELEVSAEVMDSGSLTINLSGDHSSPADVWLLVYDEKNVTNVKSGENKGKTMTNFNVVREFESVGKWQGESATIEASVDSLEENQNCAVIVQKFDSSRQRVSGPIIGAAVCSKAS